MSGMGLGLGMTRTTEIGEDGQIIISSPADVPEVAAGYWWHPSMAIGIGGAGFAVPEGNGHATFALVQANPLNQPTVLTENGQTQFRMRKTGDANPSNNLVTAAAVAAGWTGATYIAAWIRLPDASGDITGLNTWFGHNLTTGNQRRIVYGSAITTQDTDTASVSTDAGLTTLFQRFAPNIYVGSEWVWTECVFDPLFVLGGSVAADRVKLFANGVSVATIATASHGTSMLDATAVIQVMCRGATANAETTDWSLCIYCPGIPSLGNRIALSRWRPPV